MSLFKHRSETWASSLFQIRRVWWIQASCVNTTHVTVRRTFQFYKSLQSSAYSAALKSGVRQGYNHQTCALDWGTGFGWFWQNNNQFVSALLQIVDKANLKKVKKRTQSQRCQFNLEGRVRTSSVKKNYREQQVRSVPHTGEQFNIYYYILYDIISCSCQRGSWSLDNQVVWH